MAEDYHETTRIGEMKVPRPSAVALF